MPELDRNSENHEIGVPKKEYVILTLLISIITLGIYNFIWYIKNAKRLNNLNTNAKLKKSVTVIALILYLVYVIFLVSAQYYLFLNTSTTNLTVAYTISDVPLEFQIVLYSLIGLSIIIGILYLILGFKVKKILNQALINKGEKTKVSGLLTLIFNLFYLQYEINRIVDDKEEKRRLAPWVILVIAILMGIVIPILLGYIIANSLSSIFGL
ncbi:MAG: hypothetical protein AABX03_04270 [Nanoarchaeota archaeon]